MQEPIDNEIPEIPQFSVMHFLMEHPEIDANINEFHEGYQKWLHECYLEERADYFISLHKDQGDEW